VCRQHIAVDAHSEMKVEAIGGLMMVKRIGHSVVFHVRNNNVEEDRT